MPFATWYDFAVGARHVTSKDLNAVSNGCVRLRGRVVVTVKILSMAGAEEWFDVGPKYHVGLINRSALVVHFLISLAEPC